MNIERPGSPSATTVAPTSKRRSTSIETKRSRLGSERPPKKGVASKNAFRSGELTAIDLIYSRSQRRQAGQARLVARGGGGPPLDEAVVVARGGVGLPIEQADRPDPALKRLWAASPASTAASPSLIRRSKTPGNGSPPSGVWVRVFCLW